MLPSWQVQYREFISRTVSQLALAIPNKSEDLSYASGLSGFLVALTCLKAYEGTTFEIRDLVEDGMWRMLSQLSQLKPDLFHGSAGVMFCALELDRYFRFGIANDIADEFDIYLQDHIKRCCESQLHFDIVSGVSGLAIYALYRARTTGRKDLLLICIDGLREMATSGAQGVYWFTRPEWIHNTPMGNRTPSGCIDLGMAHGQVGVIACLANALDVGFDQRTSSVQLLRDALRMLRHHYIQESKTIAQVVGSEGKAQCSWCYGSLSTAFALRSAARSLDDIALIAWADELVLEQSKCSTSDLGFSNPWFCHGTSGSAWLLRKYSDAYETIALEWSALHLEGGRLNMESAFELDSPNMGILNGIAGAALTFAEALGRHNILQWSLPLGIGGQKFANSGAPDFL